MGVQMLVMIVIAYLLLPYLGFSVGLALFTAAAMKFIESIRRFCVASRDRNGNRIHFVFGEWLSIPLPAGIVGW